jgi:hypothetical protein
MKEIALSLEIVQQGNGNSLQFQNTTCQITDRGAMKGQMRTVCGLGQCLTARIHYDVNYTSANVPVCFWPLRRGSPDY